jgi:hypothetical protein
MYSTYIDCFQILSELLCVQMTVIRTSTVHYTSPRDNVTVNPEGALQHVETREIVNLVNMSCHWSSLPP